MIALGIIVLLAVAAAVLYNRMSQPGFAVMKPCQGSTSRWPNGISR